MKPTTLTRRLSFGPTRLILLAGFIGALLWQTGIFAAPEPGDLLTSRPAAKTEAPPAVKIGDEIKTEAGQRRRVMLHGGVALYLNEKSRVKIAAANTVTLEEGEIFLDVPAGLKVGDVASKMIVTTSEPTLRSWQGKWGVKKDKSGITLQVAAGHVTIDDKKSVPPGHRVLFSREPKASEATPMPRASHALDWIKDLVIAAESPLVPGSQYAGGSLVAHDPDGQEAKISLRKFHVDVHIEDGFARTTIDQTYFNHESLQLEGTFYFPLPADASLSRLAMYVDGNLMEGGMAERDHARNVYETIRYANRDPALLEWLDGTTFKMRVFPLEPRTEKRIILSYSQRLESLYGQSTYRFPAGHNLKAVDQLSFHARIKDGADVSWNCPSHKLKEQKDAADLVLDASAKIAKVDRDVVLQILPTPLAGKEKEAAPRFAISSTKEGHYLSVRYGPELKIKNQKSQIKNPTWVFLFESSGDRDPLLGRAQIEIIRQLLTHIDPEDKFLVATANTRVKFASAKPQAASDENIKAAVEFLESAHLIGALDLGSALKEALRAGSVSDGPGDGNAPTYLVHVGSGIAAMGEKRDEALVKTLPEGTAYVGIGVGRRWNRSFMKAAAEATGGHFTPINPDEPIAWRAFDLFATLHTPRMHHVEVMTEDGKTETAGEDGKPVLSAPRFLAMQETLSQGEELFAVTRVGGQGSQLPKSIKVRGIVNGKKVEQVLKVGDAKPEADYLPRTWAKLEIDRLLAKDGLKNKETIVNLSKAMYVMTPFTSLLVLEHEDLYTQYKVDKGRKDHWAMYDCPQKIPVVYEPEAGQPDPKKLMGKPTVKQVMESLASRSAGVADGRVIRRSVGGPGATFGIWNAANGTKDKFRGIPSGNLGVQVSETVTGSITLGAASQFQQNIYFPIGGGAPPPPRVGQIIIAGGDVLGSDWLDAKSSDHLPVGGGTQDVQEQVFELLPSVHELATRELRTLREDLREIKGEWRRFWLTDQPPMKNGHFMRNEPALVPPPVSEGGPDEYSFAVLSDRMPKPSSLLYNRPKYLGNDAIFYDLLAYAPGMNTSRADVEAVIEAEAFPSLASKAGQIDASARELFAKAKLSGWHSLAIADENKKTGLVIAFDGSGKYVYEQKLSPGIAERVVCDGDTIKHLYPSLYVSAKRQTSRFHRADFAAVVPWYLPPVEDFAHGADVKLVGQRTIAIVPHYEAKLRELIAKLEQRKDEQKGDKAPKIEWLRLHLVFGEDGKLAERQLVRMPDEKIIYRQVLEASGDLRVLDEKGKEVHIRKGKLTPLDQPPSMAADTKDLLVVDLPYRSAAHSHKTLKIEKKQLQELRLAEAIPLFCAYIGEGKGNEALQVFQRAIAVREQKQLGFYVLMASCGVNLDSQNADVLGEHSNEPLAQYLALHTSPVLRKHASQWAVVSNSWPEGFLQHLAQTHALYQKWQSDRVLKGDAAKVKQDRQRALDYVRKNQSAFGWALLCLMQDRAIAFSREPKASADGDKSDTASKEFHAELAEAFRLFEKHPALGSSARYEVARSLYKSGKLAEARKGFTDIYRQTLKDEMLPALDGDFRQALLGRDGEKDGWSTLIRETAGSLVKDMKRPAVLALASQCWQLGDEPLANTLLDTARVGIDDAKEKTGMQLACLDFLWQTKQIPQADALLQDLGKDKELFKKAGLWRLGVQFAEQRDMPDRTLECLEKALEAEFVAWSKPSLTLPARDNIIDLRSVRQEYGKLLGHYEKLAESMVTLKIRPPADFLAKVVRAADRWRALDAESTEACNTTAWILQRLGEKELAWDYLTTPVAHKPSESGPWLDMATNLSRRGVLDLADRAYKAAFEAEPTNAQILWDRATNLRQAGKSLEAQALYRQIAESDWQPRFQGLRNQARALVAGN